MRNIGMKIYNNFLVPHCQYADYFTESGNYMYHSN